MGGLILGAILQYMVSASFNCFFMVSKGLKVPCPVKLFIPWKGVGACVRSLYVCPPQRHVL